MTPAQAASGRSSSEQREQQGDAQASASLGPSRSSPPSSRNSRTSASAPRAPAAWSTSAKAASRGRVARAVALLDLRVEALARGRRLRRSRSRAPLGPTGARPSSRSRRSRARSRWRGRTSRHLQPGAVLAPRTTSLIAFLEVGDRRRERTLLRAQLGGLAGDGQRCPLASAEAESRDPRPPPRVSGRDEEPRGAMGFGAGACAWREQNSGASGVDVNAARRGSLACRGARRRPRPASIRVHVPLASASSPAAGRAQGGERRGARGASPARSAGQGGRVFPEEPDARRRRATSRPSGS
jgi:hypothetical protein